VKEKAAQEKEFYQRQISMSRGGSRRAGDRNEFSNPQQVGPDGWAVAGSGSGPPRPPPKAGDLSNFGKTQPMSLWPGANNLFCMGNFGTMGTGSKLSSEERHANSNRAASVSGAPGMQTPLINPGTPLVFY
jgi:translation initiation factor 4G